MKINKKVIIGIIISIILILLINLILLLNRDDSVGDKGQVIEGEITFVSNRTDKRTEINNLINEFEKINPKVKVKLELIGDAEGILERKASVGELPDVTLVPSVIDAKELNNYFLPIDDLGFNEGNIYSYKSGVGSDKKLYSLATSMSWHGVVYNKKIFNELDITSIPKTEDEFFDICNKIKDNNIVPVALNYKQSWIMSMWVDMIPYLYNSSMEDDILLLPKDVLGDNSEIYKSLNFVHKIYANGYSEDDLLHYDWTQCKNDIIGGKVAMTIWNSDFIKQLEELGMNKGDIGIFPIPETNEIELFGDYRIGVSKNTKYPEAAKEFLKFLFEEDRYTNTINTISNNKENKETAIFLKELDDFNIPVRFQENALFNQNEAKNRRHDKFFDLKNEVGIDYSLVQKYIISNDIDSLRDETNKRWRNYRGN